MPTIRSTSTEHPTDCRYRQPVIDRPRGRLRTRRALVWLMELSKSVAARPWWVQSTVDAHSRRDAVVSGSASSASARVAWFVAMLIAALPDFIAVQAVHSK